MDNRIFQTHHDLVDEELTELEELKQDLEDDGWDSAASSVSVFLEDGRYVKELLETLAEGNLLPIRSAKVYKMANRWMNRAREIKRGAAARSITGDQSFFLQTEQI